MWIRHSVLVRRDRGGKRSERREGRKGKRRKRKANGEQIKGRKNLRFSDASLRARLIPQQSFYHPQSSVIESIISSCLSAESSLFSSESPSVSRQTFSSQPPRPISPCQPFDPISTNFATSAFVHPILSTGVIL